MFRPTIKSNAWLGVMAVVFLLLFYWSEHSHITVRADNYHAKIEAALTMHEALIALQDYRLPKLESSGGERHADPVVYTMLGEKDSPITTDDGRLEDKITILNPNFAAAVVDMFIKAGVKPGDNVAVLLTGGMPGANLAVYSAAKALRLNLVTITSVGSSWWGANSPDFTWLDMERVLSERGIFPYRSVAASLGGADDQGGLRLSAFGRQAIRDAVDRNGILLIMEGQLNANILARLEVFKRARSLDNYRAVVNVGGGIAAIGDRENGHLIPNGVNLRLPTRNYPNLGTIHYFARSGVPVIHLWDIIGIAEQYELPIARLPLPEAGEGSVFESQHYNIVVAAIVLIIMFTILVVVKYFDRKSYVWSAQDSDPDAVI